MDSCALVPVAFLFHDVVPLAFWCQAFPTIVAVMCSLPLDLLYHSR